MVQFYLKSTNQLVKVGDKCRIKFPTKTEFGDGVTEVVTTLTPPMMPLLVSKGFIYIKDVKPKVNKQKEIEEITPQIVDILSEAVNKLAAVFGQQAERPQHGK